MIRLLVDENVPDVDCFSELGPVRRMPGRAIGPADVADVDALIVRSVTTVNRALLAGSPVLFVGSATAGIDHVDRADLDALGIRFAHAPGSNADSVVDYVLAVLATRYARVSELQGARVGIVGHGEVGSRLSRRLRELGVVCRVCDPLLPAEDVPGWCGLDDALQAEIVTLHVPLTMSGPHATVGMINATRLASLLPGTLLINTARGDVVDEMALGERLRTGADLAVTLDVWHGEPAIDATLLQRIDVATPHIAGYAWDGKQRGTRMVYEALCAFLGRQPRSVTSDHSSPQCALPKGEFDTAALTLLRGCYDIAAESAHFRAAMNTAPDPAVVFDRMRRDYPRRRELSAWRLQSVAVLSDQQRRQLAALGFSVTGA